MSIQTNLAVPALQASEVPVTVKLGNGRVVSAVRVATYQINPLTGKGSIVKDTLKYLDVAGDEIDDVAELTFCNIPQGDTVMWFGSPDGSPIYLGDDNTFRNWDGTPFTGDTTGYQAGGGETNHHHHYADGHTGGTGGTGGDGHGFIAVPTIISAYAYFAFALGFFMPVRKLTSVTVNADGSVTMGDAYYVGGQPIGLPEGATVVDELPPSTFKMQPQIVRPGNRSVAPTDLPISGVSVSWVVMLPTIYDEDDVLETPTNYVKVGDTVMTISDTINLNSEQALSTVIPPDVEVVGDAYAQITYRLRTSPILVTSIAELPELSTVTSTSAT